MTTIEQADPRAALTTDPLRFGVGARLTVAFMAENYVELIGRVLDEADARSLTVRTGDVSTYLGGSEWELLRYLTDLVDAVARTGEHASVTLHLSRGCPGEAVCELPGGAGPRSVTPPGGREIGRTGAGEWALYPLADQVVDGVAPDHMRDILEAIDLARTNGTFVASEHFVTRLAGDLGRILETVVAGWVLVGRSVQHVTSHLTLSLNSPSHHGSADV